VPAVKVGLQELAESPHAQVIKAQYLDLAEKEQRSLDPGTTYLFICRSVKEACACSGEGGAGRSHP
jgi:hypothetical protein